MADREEILTEFDGIRIRSAIEAVEVEDNSVTFRIEWPEIEFDEEFEDG